jgi:PDZ domain
MTMWTRLASLAVLAGITYPGAVLAQYGGPAVVPSPPIAPANNPEPAITPAPGPPTIAPGDNPEPAIIPAPRPRPGSMLPAANAPLEPDPSRARRVPQAYRIGPDTAYPVGQNANVLFFRDPADETLGATLEPVSDTLRAQLALPAGRGLIVTTIDQGGAAFKAGILANDILLTLADHPLAAPDDLTKQLKTVGEHEVALTLLRRGEAATLKVRPVYRVTLGPAEAETSEYYLGVVLGGLDQGLWSQLKMTSKKGVVVNGVEPGSPAEKAGIKLHDILLGFGNPVIRNIESPEQLASVVNEQKDKPMRLTLLRAGKAMSVEVTPEKRTVKAEPLRGALRVLTLRHADSSPFTVVSQPVGAQQSWANVVRPAEPSDARIEVLEKEIKAMQTSLDEIRDLLKARKSAGN